MNTNNWLFWTLLTVTIICLIFWLKAMWKDENSNNTLNWGFTLFLGCILCGWGLFGSLIPVKFEENKIICDVSKTDASIILSHEGQPILTLIDAKSYNTLSKTNKIEVTQSMGFSMYNAKLKTAYSIK